MSTASRRGWRVAFDIQALQNPLHRERGIGRYVTDHVDALLAAAEPVAALLLNPGLAEPVLPAHWYARGVVCWNTPHEFRALARSSSGERLIYHVPSPFEPCVPEGGIVVPHALRLADHLVVMLHDVIPYVFPNWYQRDDATRSFFRRRAELVRTADLVVTNSEHTRRDAITLLGLDERRVVTQGTGASDFFSEGEAQAPHRAPSVRDGYLLTVTGWGDPRKDMATLLDAYSRLAPTDRAAHQLAVVCDLPPEGRAAWCDAARRHGIADDDIVFTGRVDDETLRNLYRGTALFVFSSRYEGFGMPVLEAACSGAPVLTTGGSSLPEILDCDDALVAPGDPAAMAAAIGRALRDTDLRARLIAASRLAAQQHRWDAVAARTVAAYGTLTTPRSRRRDLPLQIAVAGPFPPSKSGIGTFNARLAAELETVHDVARFTEGDDCFPPPPSGRRYRQYPIAALGRTIAVESYDTAIYTIGNGYYHRRTLDIARRAPGVVWLHDAELAGLYLTAAGLFLPGHEPRPATIAAARAVMRAAVERVYGADSEPLGDDEWWRGEAYAARGFTFIEEVAGGARAVIVNTQAAAATVAARVPDAVVHVLPHPFPEHSLPRAPRDDDLVVCFGWVDPLKRPHDLIRAVGIAAQRLGRSIRLAFVGEVSEVLHRELEELARREASHAHVEFAGFTDGAAYLAWLARATIVVQLRAATHGEASGALCDAIAAGRATITSLATARELPDDTVVHVRPDAPPDAIATAVERLLTDDAQRTAIERAALAHAVTWRYRDLAAAVTDLVASLGPRPVSGLGR